MVDDHGDDEILELTEEMTSVPPEMLDKDEEGSQSESGVEADDLRESAPPPRVSSPFPLIKKPREKEFSKESNEEPSSGEDISKKKKKKKKEAAEDKSSSHSHYVPEVAEVPVVAIPIQQIGQQVRDSKPPRSFFDGDGKFGQKASSEEDLKDAASWEVAAENSQVESGIETEIELEAEDAEEEVLDLTPEMTSEIIEEATDDDEPFDLTEEMTESSADEEAAQEADKEDEETGEEEAAEENEEVDDEEAAAGETEGAEADEADDVEDLGTPEAVFDSVSDDSEYDEVITEEIDISDVEELGKIEAVEEEQEDDEAAEEIDVGEMEEISEPQKAAPPAGRSTGARTPRMRRRRGKREWWATIFDDDYLSILPEETPRNERRCVDFIEKNLGVAPNSLVLDLACGNGKHAVGMASRGYRVVGVDLSLPMLARAGDLAQEADQKINFIHGDMRDLGFDKTFDAAYCIGTSFGYFDEATNFKVLEGIARALKPGAPFLFEVANRDNVIGTVPNLTWFQGTGSVCMEETDFNFINSRLYVTRQLIMDDGSRQVKHDLSLRLYSLHELGLMLHNAGFKVSRVAGHMATSGAFFGAESARIIIVASRPR